MEGGRAVGLKFPGLLMSNDVGLSFCLMGNRAAGVKVIILVSTGRAVGLTCCIGFFVLFGAGRCGLMSNGAVVLRVGVLVICRAVVLRVVGLVIRHVDIGLGAVAGCSCVVWCGEMSSYIIGLLRNGAVGLKVSVLVIRGAAVLKMFALVLVSTEAVGLMSNTVGVVMAAGRCLGVLVFRRVLGCSAVRQYRVFLSDAGIWFGLAVHGNFLRLEKRLVLMLDAAELGFVAKVAVMVLLRQVFCLDLVLMSVFFRNWSKWLSMLGDALLSSDESVEAVAGEIVAR